MRSLLILLFLSLFCTCVRAQSAINFGRSYLLRFEFLEEDRTLNVLLPTEYTGSVVSRYPVIYLLDGATDEDFFHAAGLLRYHDDHGKRCPAILVGIANVDRKRDLTYPGRDSRDRAYFPTTGGSVEFIGFFLERTPRLSR